MENTTFRTISLWVAGVVLVVVGLAGGRWLESRDETLRVVNLDSFGNCLRQYAGEIDDKEGKKVVVVLASGIETCAATIEYIEQSTGL